MTSGQQLRNDGISRVASKNAAWVHDVIARVRAMPVGHRFMVEDLRRNHPAKPTHHNAWGAVGMAIKRQGLAREVELKSARARRSHARRMPVYERVAEDDFE